MSARHGDPAPPSYYDLYGSADANNEYAVGPFRRGRCYELAAWALTLGTAPADAVLVHGSIDGGSELGRFGHAWLVLADGRVWEPTQARVYGSEFIDWAEARAEVTYTREETRRMLFVHDHYGPWHDATEHRVVSHRENDESKVPYFQRLARSGS